MKLPIDPVPTVNPQGGAATGGAPPRVPYQQLDTPAAAFGGAAAHAAEKLGTSLGQAGDMMASNALRLQAEANEAGAKEALSGYAAQERAALFDPKTGYYAQRGKAAVDALDPTAAKLKQLRDDATAQLTNPEQQRMFRGAALARTDAALDGMSRHAAAERRTWMDQTSQGIVDTQLADAGDYYNDPTRFELALNGGVREIQNHARDNGVPVEQARAREQQFVSKAWTARLDRLRLDDPVGAEKLYRENEGLMHGPEAAALGRQLKVGAMTRQAGDIARSVVARRSTEPNAAGQTLASAAELQESNGDTTAISPKGARGVMQLMPDTARETAADLGLPFDVDRLNTDPTYNRTLGAAHLDKMLARYGGNQTLALAAYNAGPGRVDQWIKQYGDPTSGAITDEQFAASIPIDETRKYVAGASARAGGAPTKFGSDWIAQARSQAEAVRPGDQQFADAAAAHAKTLITEMRFAQEEASQAQAGARAKYVSDLTIGVSRGQKTYADIEDATAQGLITPTERTHFTLQLDQQAAQQQNVTDAIHRVSIAADGGQPLDPKQKGDRDALDLHYGQTAKSWGNLPAAEMVDRQIQYATTFGIAPTPVKNEIRAGLRSTDPKQALAASDMVARLRNANPQILNDFADEDIKVANLVGSYASYGVPPARALELATDALKTDKATQEARTKAYDEAAKVKPVKDWIAGKLNSMWTIDPDVDPVMGGEFDRLAHAEYERTGNLDAARQTSLDLVQRVWGRTAVGGAFRYMKYAPEKFYGVNTLSPGDNAKWMNQQLLDDVVGAGGLTDGKVTADRLMLQPDPARTDADGRPVYQVHLVDKTGVMHVITGQDGNAMHWVPSWDTSKAAKQWRDQHADQVEQLRAGRAGTFNPVGAALISAGGG